MKTIYLLEYTTPSGRKRWVREDGRIFHTEFLTIAIGKATELGLDADTAICRMEVTHRER